MELNFNKIVRRVCQFFNKQTLTSKIILFILLLGIDIIVIICLQEQEDINELLVYFFSLIGAVLCCYGYLFLLRRWRKVVLRITVVTSSVLALSFIGIFLYYAIPDYLHKKEIESKCQTLLRLSQEANDSIKFEYCYNICDSLFYQFHEADEDTLYRLAWDMMKVLAYNGYAKAQHIIAGRYYGFWYDSQYLNREKYRNRDGYEVYENPFIDLDKAAYWYQEAAFQGFAPAMRFLALCYYEGEGVERNFFKAVYWMKKAVEKDDAWAYYYLGIFYEESIQIRSGEHWEKEPDAYYYNWHSKSGYQKVDDYKTIIPHNIDSAKFYWKKALSLGCNAAKDKLEKIYD